MWSLLVHEVDRCNLMFYLLYYKLAATVNLFKKKIYIYICCCVREKLIQNRERKGDSKRDRMKKEEKRAGVYAFNVQSPFFHLLSSFLNFNFNSRVRLTLTHQSLFSPLIVSSLIIFFHSKLSFPFSL
jgi:hypothetical protein